MALMMQVARWVPLAFAWLLAVPALVLLVQVCVAVFARPRRESSEDSEQRPQLAVLMPAHDESSGIAAAIETVLPQLDRGDRLLVVADNCNDDTAGIARAAGAEVVERDDPSRCGKGFALDFGVRRLAAQPPAVVVVVDADCAAGPHSLARLASRCEQSQRPVQALYLMRAPSGSSLKTRIAEFAWVVKNQVRPLGLLRLGLPCQLMGTGMAFPWKMIRAASLASGHLVEDLQLGLDLAVAGAPPLFCPAARVTSVFPNQTDSAVAQRTRWEHGHLSLIASAGPRLLWRGLRTGRFALAAMALDLCVPPLAWLVLVASGFAAITAGLVLFGGPVAPLIVALGALGAIAFAVITAWRNFGSRIVSFGELLAVPSYVLGKLPIYARLFRKRQVDWVRTERDDRSD